jgi:hypothetical protein
LTGTFLVKTNTTRKKLNLKAAGHGIAIGILTETEMIGV